MSETLDRFIAGLSFEPDDYQVKACQDLDDGDNEHAIELSLIHI